MFRGSPWRILGLGSWAYWAGGVGVSVYRCIAAVRRRSLPGPPWIGVLPQSCADRSRGPPGSVYRCIGVLPQSCADRSHGPPGSVYRCITAVRRRSLPGPPWIGVSVYCRTPAPIAPRASLDRCITAIPRRSLPMVPGSVYRCISVLPQSCADRSQGPPGSVYRCVGVLPQSRADRSQGPPGSVYRCIGVLPQSRAVRSQCPLDRCIGVSVYYRSPAPIAPRAALDRCIGVSVYYRSPAPDRSQDPPGSVYRCIAAILRRSLTGPPWVGVSVYRCMGRGDRCIGVSVYFNFPAPSSGRTVTKRKKLENGCCWGFRGAARPGNKEKQGSGGRWGGFAF